MNNIIKKTSSFILKLIFPPACASCGELIDDGALCPVCREKWETEKTGFCPVCGKKHVDCICRLSYGKYSFPLIRLTNYNREFVSSCMIFKIKNGRSRRVTDFLASELSRAAAARRRLSGKLVTYVPRSRSSVRMTGTDQARSLAVSFADLNELPFESLFSRRGEKKQKELSLSERRENARSSFILSSNARQIIFDSDIILIDDVVTTGFTISYCAYLLMEMGASSVICLSIARREPSEENGDQNIKTSNLE